MLQKQGERLSAWAYKYIPDPFIFVLILTLVTMLGGILFTSSSLWQMIEYWHKGFWDLLKFSMQMCLILVTGYALATTQVMASLIAKLAAIPKNTGNAAMLIALVAIITGYINWGLAIVVGALLTREVAKNAHLNGISMHYPLLGAAGYMGLAVWHGGFSGSATLAVATQGHFLEQKIGIIPVAQTLFSPLNIAVAIFAIVCLPLLCKLLAPKDDSKVVTIEEVLPNFAYSPEQADPPKENTMASKLENSFALSLLVSLCGLSYVCHYFYTKGFKLNLNIVNFTFLSLGMLLHKSPRNYVDAVSEGARGCAGVILQFPFYAGILGMMKFSGLLSLIATQFVAISNPTTFPIFTFISAAIVNLFVPSGGGQWAVQGPIVVEAAIQMKASLPTPIMAFAYGDQWTNLLQPFWALVLLGITGLKANQIMGYCITVMLVGAIFFPIILLVFA